MNIFETLAALLRELGQGDLADRVEAYGATRVEGYDGEPIADADLEAILAGLIALSEDDTVHADVIVAAADVADVVRDDQESRAAEAEAEEGRRQDAAARLRGEQAQEGDGDGEGGDDDEGGDDPGDGDGEGDGEGAQGAQEGGEGDGTGDGAGDTDPAREPVTAGSSRRNLRARRSAPATPPPPEAADVSPITWGDNAAGQLAGTTVTDIRDVDRAMERRWQGFRRSPANGREELHVATVHGRFPEERRLLEGDGLDAEPVSSGTASRRISAAIENAIDRAMGQRNAAEAILAAGGLCTLPTPIYNVPQFGSTARPIRDTALVSFQAARGGVTDLTPPTLASLAGAVSAWTVANDVDAAPDGIPSKPCLRVTCGAQRSAQLEAIPLCLTYGNFLARTYSELTTAWSNLGNVAHARFAEARLLASMITLSTTVTTAATDWSASRDFLEHVSRAAWGMRSRHRLEDDFPFIAVFSNLVFAVMQVDISRQMPGGSTQENLALAGAQIREWFTVRNIVPVLTPDLNVIGAQAESTTLAHWPPTVDLLVYPAGTFLHLDGGELNLGVVRDSALNKVNDFQTFSETFEAVFMAGIESIHMAIDICPSGAVSGTIDPAPFCATYT